MTTMNDRLRQHIAEIYDGSAWEAVTGIIWEDGFPWQLFSFDLDIDFEGERRRCVIVQRVVYDAEDIEAVDYTEDIFSRSARIEEI